MLNRKYKFNVFFIILLAVCLGSSVCAETVYFLVGEISPSYNDSYVLPLSDPCDIAHARDLIEYGPDEIIATIAVAPIERWDPNNGININRDYLQKGIPAWSWYVTGFYGFGEFAIEECDGWPTGVEDSLEAWVGEGGVGQVCFWAYTVIAELGTDLEPWNCDLDVNSNVNFDDWAMFAAYWQDSNCSHRYYCEGTDIDGSGIVDSNDIAIIARNWLWEEP